MNAAKNRDETMKMTATFGILLLFTGCVAFQIDKAIEDYVDVRDKVQLGDSKGKFLEIIYPTQEKIGARYRKYPESFRAKGKTVEIFYIRSGRQPDNLTTDDEFTPYVFIDDQLEIIGWTALGGPGTTGKALQQVIVNNYIR